MSRSLESVLGGSSHKDKWEHSGGRIDARRAMFGHVIQDPRRFSEANIVPPPRPPPPNLKPPRYPPLIGRNRRPPMPQGPPQLWPLPPQHPQLVQPQPHPGSVNLTRIAHMARSMPQLDGNGDKDQKERERGREKYPQYVQLDKEGLIRQVLFSF